MQTANNLEIPALQPFNRDKYLTLTRSEVGGSFTPVGVELKPEGVKLVADYYAQKYSTKILITREAKEINDYISVIRQRKGNIRQGFILRSDVHSIPIIYVREGNKEAIIYGDSLGEVPDKSPIKNLRKTGVEVFQLEVMRQADDFSCHTDALVFLREFLGKYQLSK